MITDENIDEVITRVKKVIGNVDLVLPVEDVRDDPFKVLVATLLSARTKDEITHQVLPKLFSRVHGPKDLVRLDVKELERLIYPVGFYRTKAKHLKRLGEVLTEKYGGRVPDRLDELITLPGVGRKTANLVLVLAHDKPGICVDTHVHRIFNRWGYLSTRTPEETERVLRERLPERYWKDINRLLVLFGRSMCKPVNPRCSTCPLNRWCLYGGKRLIREWYKLLWDQFGPQNWWPVSCERGDPRYEIIVGAVLTQNTAWKNVERALEGLCENGLLEPHRLLREDPVVVKRLIRPAGYYNQKYERLLEVSRWYLERSSDRVDMRDELLGIKGIGPETADSILLYGFDVPVFVVDAYTVRLLERHGFITRNEKEVWFMGEMVKGKIDLYHRIQEMFHLTYSDLSERERVKVFKEYHALIVELGKRYCKSRDPMCEECPLGFDIHE